MGLPNSGPDLPMLSQPRHHFVFVFAVNVRRLCYSHSPFRVPRSDITLQIVWNVPRQSMMLSHWPACFQMIWTTLSWIRLFMLTTMSCKYSIYRMFSDCFKISEIVEISVAGAFIVGIYPKIYRDRNFLCYCIHVPGNYQKKSFVASNLHCFVIVICGC